MSNGIWIKGLMSKLYMVDSEINRFASVSRYKNENDKLSVWREIDEEWPTLEDIYYDQDQGINGGLLYFAVSTKSYSSRLSIIPSRHFQNATLSTVSNAVKYSSFTKTFEKDGYVYEDRFKLSDMVSYFKSWLTSRMNISGE